MTLRKTKIVCTIGPAVRDFEKLKQLLVEGMNIARLNFSHGDHAYHAESIAMIREVSQQSGIPVALLLDTKGPEIRTGRTKDDQTILLISGKEIILTSEEVEGSQERLSISYTHLPQEVSPGKHIYIADGVIDLEVLKVEGNDIHCMIRQGGMIGSRKNVNVIGIRTALPAITEQDERDIVFGITHQVDFIAASFVRKSGDILEIRRILDEHGSKIHLIAKIEDEEGVENIDEILNVANGIMIARGDLGVQLETEDIPLVQKRIIRKCHNANKPVITATQMLDSMIHNPRPTRAESSDVANAIFDGTDAVMLSGETASGQYPILAVQTMHKIAVRVENSTEYCEKMRHYFDLSDSTSNIATAVAQSAYMIARDIGASAILTPTLRGNTPKLISKYRPEQAIIGVATTESVQRNLLLYWGVYPIVSGLASGSDVMINNALAIALQKQYICNADRVVTVAGIPINSPVMLNTIRVHVISTILGKGRDGFGKIKTGRIVKARDLGEAVLRIEGSGYEILVTNALDYRFKPLLPKLAGMILEDYSTVPQEEILMLNPELTMISGVADALAIFESDLTVSIDGEEKLIYEGLVAEK
ncbi:MAG: pyruvate kinase [Candidatus Vecturithrix sp.]|nr:pyruvate kinase [Candidatus Vecturithrix sp.]